MKQPSLADTAVKVSAYLTDETFGYEHWRAAQFSTPRREKYGVLLLFDTEAEADTHIEVARGDLATLVRQWRAEAKVLETIREKIGPPLSDHNQSVAEICYLKCADELEAALLVGNKHD